VGKAYENDNKMLDKLKTEPLHKIMIDEGAVLYHDLNGLELIDEDTNGDELLRINEGVISLDNDLNDLKNLSIKNGKITLSDFSYSYKSPSQFFDSHQKPNFLYLRVVNSFFKKANLKKCISLIYDNELDEHALAITTPELFKMTYDNLGKLNSLENDSPVEAAKFINKVKPRVIGITGFEKNDIVSSGVVIHEL
jgi:hypothetical protein